MGCPILGWDVWDIPSWTWTRSTRSSRLAKCALVTFNHLIFPSQEKIPFTHVTSHPRMGYAIHPIPGWDYCIPSQDGTSHTSHPRMGHSIHPIPGWDSCIPSQDGIFHTSHPRMGLLHPIPGWDIPYIPSQDGIIASHPRMGHPIHPIPGWDYCIPSQDGTSHTSHPRMGLRYTTVRKAKHVELEKFVCADRPYSIQYSHLVTSRSASV